MYATYASDTYHKDTMGGVLYNIMPAKAKTKKTEQRLSIIDVIHGEDEVLLLRQLVSSGTSAAYCCTTVYQYSSNLHRA